MTQERDIVLAEYDKLKEALRSTCGHLANYTFQGRDISLGEEADALYAEAIARAAIGEQT
jgi:hypothetical protein